MKVLNLYACLGGNRLLWDSCEVTAVELDPELARMYEERFPNDQVIVADAHQYLLDHYKEFDFIWSSPPCPTHSRARFWASKGMPEKVKPVFPDMKLWQEIIFLENFFEGKWVVENVTPYYKPLIAPSQEINKHLFWSNFTIPGLETRRQEHFDKVEDGEKFHSVDLSSYKGDQRKDKIVRNMVEYELGKHIFDLARGIYEHNNQKQGDLFSQ